MKWSDGSNLADCNYYLKVSIKLCAEEPPCPVSFPNNHEYKSTVRGQGKATENEKEKKPVVLFIVHFSFPLSVSYLLLLLTTVIYGGHPSSGFVHHLLVARRSWQQLRVVRGVWSSHSQALTSFPSPPDSTLSTVPVSLAATSHKHNPSSRPKLILYS